MASKVVKPPKTAAGKVSTKVGANPADDGTKEVSEEKLRLLAYLKWEAAGKPAGDGGCYWLDAERELRQM